MQTEQQPGETAEIRAFPMDGFIIGLHHCRASGPEPHNICLRDEGHDGEHSWSDWRGTRVRVPGFSGTVRFGGFAR